MENALEEFEEHTDGRAILCAAIQLGQFEPETFNLPRNHNQEQYDEFLKALNFEYDSGYGGQELFGTIWYKDGTWSDRGEYDGSEWWQHQQCPPIPETL